MHNHIVSASFLKIELKKKKIVLNVPLMALGGVVHPLEYWHSSDVLCKWLKLNNTPTAFAPQAAGQSVWLPCSRSLPQISPPLRIHGAKKKKISRHFFFWLFDFQKNKHLYLSFIGSINASCLSPSIRLSLTWFVLILHLFPHCSCSPPATLAPFFSVCAFFSSSPSPCSLWVCNRHHWQWEQHIHCQEGLPRVCLRLCVRALTWLCLFLSRVIQG